MQTPPKPAIPGAKPVRSCESLASVALPNTTIESAAVEANNPAVCRVTAVTTHPPAGDKVRIWVAIPTSNWNGPFKTLKRAHTSCRLGNVRLRDGECTAAVSIDIFGLTSS